VSGGVGEFLPLIGVLESWRFGAIFVFIPAFSSRPSRAVGYSVAIAVSFSRRLIPAIISKIPFDCHRKLLARHKRQHYSISLFL
jgi:hypothetical protein